MYTNIITEKGPQSVSFIQRFFFIMPFICNVCTILISTSALDIIINYVHSNRAQCPKFLNISFCRSDCKTRGSLPKCLHFPIPCSILIKQMNCILATLVEEVRNVFGIFAGFGIDPARPSGSHQTSVLYRQGEQL